MCSGSTSPRAPWMSTGSVWPHWLRQGGSLAGRSGAGDLCGPRFRVGRIEPDGQVLAPARRSRSPRIAGWVMASGSAPTTHHFAEDVQPGDEVFIDEGRIMLRAVDRRAARSCARWSREVHSTAERDQPAGTPICPPPLSRTRTGAVRTGPSRQGLTLPGLELRPLAAGRPGLRVRAFRDPCRDRSQDRDQAGLAHLEAIGRGQRRLPAGSRRSGRGSRSSRDPRHPTAPGPGVPGGREAPMVATHILHSMVTSPVPTRAEARRGGSSLARAQGLVLTGETAVGQHPVEVVRTLRRSSQSHRVRSLLGWATPTILHGQPPRDRIARH